MNTCAVLVFAWVIQSFAEKQTGNLFYGRKRKPKDPLPERYADEAKLVASDVEELAFPPSSRLHQLGGKRSGQYSISISMQHQVCFRFEGGDAQEVEIADYHG